MQIRIRSFHTFIEHKLLEAGQRADAPLRKIAAVAIIENPYAGRYVEDLKPLIEASADLGRELAALAVRAIEPYPAESYGKAAIVGTAGEQEHANAVLTTTFADPLRKAIGGGTAWISSFTKRGAPGTVIDVPLAYKDALYVRSHYDGMTIMLPDAPQADEIAVIVCLANRGRLNARVGGLARDQAKGQDGLS
ncbi:MAG: hypothetical protein JWO70_1666 [Betaproteobacteria bacterium]|nr:hypothetical protein [Betaproteobacteria bacterium]